MVEGRIRCSCSGQRRSGVFFIMRAEIQERKSVQPAYNFPSTAPGGGIFPYIYTPSAPKFYPNQSIEAISTNFKDSSVYQFNLSVQRQLPYKVSLSAAYVGTLGRHLSTFVDANYAPYSTVFGTPSTAAASLDARRQYDGGTPGAAGTLTGITELISDQMSNYNGLQISATKSMSRGFSVSGFYVWSQIGRASGRERG